MVAKKKPETSEIITPDQLRMYLILKMQMLKLDVKGYAEMLGVSRQMIFMVMSGSRKPSEDLLNKFGLATGYRLPGAPEVIAPDQLQMLVVVKMQTSKLGARGYAKKLGIHEQTLYAIAAGTRPTSKSLMAKLELETVYRII